MSSHTTDLASLYEAEHGRLRRLLIQRGVPAAVAADDVQEAFTGAIPDVIAERET